MAAAEVQALLRFLTQDAKIPLAEALPKIGALRKQGLNTPIAIAEADQSKVKDIFVDEKVIKQITNAAKRASNPKKRTASQSSSPQTKRFKTSDQTESRDIEAELTLPTTELPVDALENICIETNRAPLVLAFALVIQEFTMSDQPLSSRLSLAQAVVSANSQSKAKSIGLVSGDTAEEEGWASGQPKLRVLNREIAVMRRHVHPVFQDGDSQETIKAEDAPFHDAFWGLDLEALRKSNGPLVAGQLAGSQGPPIHRPQAARSYLLKSMSLAGSTNHSDVSPTNTKKKQSAAEVIAAKEKATATLLESIRIVCKSWASTLSTNDLDKRAWSWYLSVRPDVAQGQSGWGQKGHVKLADILKLRRSC